MRMTLLVLLACATLAGPDLLADWFALLACMPMIRTLGLERLCSLRIADTLDTWRSVA